MQILKDTSSNITPKPEEVTNVIIVTIQHLIKHIYKNISMPSTQKKINSHVWYVGLLPSIKALLPCITKELIPIEHNSSAKFAVKKQMIPNVCFLTNQPHATNIDNRGLDIVVPGWWIRQTDCKGTAWEGIKMALVSKANIFLRL